MKSGGRKDSTQRELASRTVPVYYPVRTQVGPAEQWLDQSLGFSPESCRNKMQIDIHMYGQKAMTISETLNADAGNNERTIFVSVMYMYMYS